MPLARMPRVSLLAGVTYLLGGLGAPAWGAIPPGSPAAAAGPAPAEVTLPAFQPGLWEYRRTIENAGSSLKPQVAVVRKCTNPNTEIEQKLADLRRKNCRFSALRRKDDHYASSWICPTPQGAVRFRDVLTAKDASAYQDVSEARSGQRVTQQKIEAQRVGDCPAATQGAPLGASAKQTPGAR